MIIQCFFCSWIFAKIDLKNVILTYNKGFFMEEMTQICQIFEDFLKIF